MEEIIMESYGKINLALDILYKREDGYHEINSIMQEIDLGDRLIFREQKEGVTIESNHPYMPKDSSNLVHRVWESLRKLTGIKKGLHITIEKNIPICAGLAGGSSNAAATFKALNQMWDLRFSEEELMDIAKGLGADIPFCIMGGTALAGGIGERLRRLKSFSNKYILLCNPGINISTPYVYSKLNLDKERLDLDSLAQAMASNDLEDVGRKLANKMEEVVIGEYPIIQDIKDKMMENGALGSLMSGSGSTVFALFDDKEKMEFTHKILSKNMDKVYISRTI